MIFGYYYILPASMLTTSGQHEPIKARLQRMYNQVSARKHLPLNTDRLRHHAEIGYL